MFPAISSQKSHSLDEQLSVLESHVLMKAFPYSFNPHSVMDFQVSQSSIMTLQLNPLVNVQPICFSLIRASTFFAEGRCSNCTVVSLSRASWSKNSLNCLHCTSVWPCCCNCHTWAIWRCSALCNSPWSPSLQFSSVWNVSWSESHCMVCLAL